MRILVRYLGAWGLGDLLCSDPMILGLKERHGHDAEVWLDGRCGNVAWNPLVAGAPPPPDATFDRVVEVRLFTHMDREAYGRLEALPSLIDHMCSYAGVTPSDRRPRLHLRPAELVAPARTGVRALGRPRIALCVDHLDPLRHWPLERWREVGVALRAAGAQLVEVGSKDRLGLGLDLVGRLSVRETAAVLGACDLFVGHNSGLFHYAQAAGTPCVTLFSLATPARFVHPGARVVPVQATHLPCIDCMTRRFAAMQQLRCIAAPRGLCMLELTVEQVLDAIATALEPLGAAPPPAVAAGPAGR
jgi:hypothetical protein